MTIKVRECSIEGCESPHRARGWCNSHWLRWRRFGDPLGKAPERRPGKPVAYLHEIVFAYEGDECLIWPFSKDRKGYGQVRFAGKLHIVSRLACQEANGPPPTPKHEAAHSCGNGHLACATKRHLSWKTRTENMADKVMHGTSMRGWSYAPKGGTRKPPNAEQTTTRRYRPGVLI